MTNNNPKSKIQNLKSIDQWIEIGTIVAPQGLKGEMRVYSNSDFPERFEQPGTRWLLKQGATEPEAVSKGIYIIELAGVENRDKAEALRDSKLMVPASDRPPLEEDEYHVLDLIGLPVFNQLTGEDIGVVVDIIPAGNDLLEVQRHPVEGKTKPVKVLIPFVKEIVPIVDLEQKRIAIAPPPGLLEIES
jgi:16S rRNA processing protein RimM